MPKETRYDGTPVEWVGLNICWCVKCREIFNSATAFDAHITGLAANRIHDFSWMPINSKGYRVSSLKEE